MYTSGFYSGTSANTCYDLCKSPNSGYQALAQNDMCKAQCKFAWHAPYLEQCAQKCWSNGFSPDCLSQHQHEIHECCMKQCQSLAPFNDVNCVEYCNSKLNL
jgi:hypothetical protein